MGADHSPDQAGEERAHEDEARRGVQQGDGIAIGAIAQQVTQGEDRDDHRDAERHDAVDDAKDGVVGAMTRDARRANGRGGHGTPALAAA